MNKLGTNLIVAILAFLIGLASASALSEFGSDKQVGAMPVAQSDAMGNVRANHD